MDYNLNDLEVAKENISQGIDPSADNILEIRLASWAGYLDIVRFILEIRPSVRFDVKDNEVIKEQWGVLVGQKVKLATIQKNLNQILIPEITNNILLLIKE